MIKLRLSLLGFLSFVLALGAPIVVNSQTMQVVDSSGKVLIDVREGQVFSSNEKIILNLKGNIIFHGISQDLDSAHLMLKVKDFLKKGNGKIYKTNPQSIFLFTRKGKVFFANDASLGAVLTTKIVNDSIVEFFDFNQKFLGSVKGRDLSSSHWVLSIDVFLNVNDLLNQYKKAAKKESPNQLGRLSSANPLRREVWVWDGKFLKPEYYSKAYAWIFDGSKIKPYIGGSMQAEWEWKNGILKPYWNSDTEKQYQIQNGTLRQYWSADVRKEWKLDGPVIEQTWNFNSPNKWYLEGEIPQPLIALIVLGVIRYP